MWVRRQLSRTGPFYDTIPDAELAREAQAIKRLGPVVRKSLSPINVLLVGP